MGLWRGAGDKLLSFLKSLIILTSFGCVNTQPYFVTDRGVVVKRCDLPALIAAAPSVPPDLHDEVARGFEYWNEVLGRRAFIFIGQSHYEAGDPDAASWLIVVSVDAGYVKDSCANTHLSWRRDGCFYETWVNINPRCAEKEEVWVESLIRHEAGHAIGLRHSDDSDELMYPWLENPNHPIEASENEIECLRRLYGE